MSQPGSPGCPSTTAVAYVKSAIGGRGGSLLTHAKGDPAGFSSRRALAKNEQRREKYGARIRTAPDLRAHGERGTHV